MIYIYVFIIIINSKNNSSSLSRNASEPAEEVPVSLQKIQVF